MSEESPVSKLFSYLKEKDLLDQEDETSFDESHKFRICAENLIKSHEAEISKLKSEIREKDALIAELRNAYDRVAAEYRDTRP